MSGIVGIEEVPQIQPAADSFAGYDTNTCRKFLRLVSPAEQYDTLLVSELTFAEWAKVMDFVPKDELYEQIQRLRNEINATYLTLSNTTAELGSIRATLASLEGIEGRLNIISGALDTVSSTIGDSRATGDEPSGGNERPSEQASKS